MIKYTYLISFTVSTSDLCEHGHDRCEVVRDSKISSVNDILDVEIEIKERMAETHRVYKSRYFKLSGFYLLSEVTE